MLFKPTTFSSTNARGFRCRICRMMWLKMSLLESPNPCRRPCVEKGWQGNPDMYKSVYPARLFLAQSVISWNIFCGRKFAARQSWATGSFSQEKTWLNCTPSSRNATNGAPNPEQSVPTVKVCLVMVIRIKCCGFTLPGECVRTSFLPKPT